MAQQQMFNSLAALVGPAEMDRLFSEYRSRLASEAAAAATAASVASVVAPRHKGKQRDFQIWATKMQAAGKIALGNSAKVSTHGKTCTYKMVKEDGIWKFKSNLFEGRELNVNCASPTGATNAFGTFLKDNNIVEHRSLTSGGGNGWTYVHVLGSDGSWHSLDDQHFWGLVWNGEKGVWNSAA
jgi:hypothetical protein